LPIVVARREDGRILAMLRMKLPCREPSPGSTTGHTLRQGHWSGRSGADEEDEGDEEAEDEDEEQQQQQSS